MTTMRKTQAGLAALILALGVAPWQPVRAGEPQTVPLYYVPGNWAQSFNGLETEFGTVFTPKAVMSDEGYRTLLATDGMPALMLSCGSHGGSVLFREPAAQRSESDHPGTATFHGSSGGQTVTLSTLESERKIVAKLTPPPGKPAQKVVDLAGLIAANVGFVLDYRRRGEAVVQYLIRPAKMAGDMAAPDNRAEAAASFRDACLGLVPSATADAAARS